MFLIQTLEAEIKNCKNRTLEFMIDVVLLF